jgi:hypothetical protein
VSQLSIPTDKRSSLLTHTAATEGVSLRWHRRIARLLAARMAARRRLHRSVPLIERDRALELRSTPAKHPGPASSQSADGAGPPMLNSARWHCTSPRRGRGVEWSDQRRGIRFHFRPRRFCRRCASDASYESVGNAGSIDVTTSDIPLRTDSVKRCKG